MGGLEVLFWIAIIIFSLLRGAKQNKKRAKQVPPSSTSNSPAPSDPLQEALREIQSALRGELPTQQPQQPSPSTSRKDPIPEIASSKRRYEPEFHSMESSIPSRDLESKTTFSERYSEKTLEKDTTYEDNFKKSQQYYDDVFQHAHPDEAKEQNSILEERTSSSVHPIRKKLKNRKGLAEAIVLQTILTRPSFPPRNNKL